MSSEKRINVTLVRSRSGRLPKHREALNTMGLKTINQTVSLRDNPATRGLLNQVGYLVKFEEK